MNKAKGKKKYTELIGIRVGKKQRAKIEEIASSKGLKISSYIRSLIIVDMNKYL